MITVGLPLYEAKDVAWICLESLCEQKTIIPWELIICEEYTKNRFGDKRLEEYMERLKFAGCKSVNYVIQERWIPLAYKWRKIVDYADDKSLVFMMCGADNYYQDLMLQQGYDGIMKGNDWYSTYECHFFDINTQKLVRYFKKYNSGVEMAMSMRSAKKIKGADRKKGIDSFVYKTVAPTRHDWNETGCGLHTVCTHGKNLISYNRGRLIDLATPPFRPTPYKLEELLPEKIIKRLCYKES